MTVKNQKKPLTPQEKTKKKKVIFVSLSLAIILSLLILFFKKSILASATGFIIVIIIISFYLYFSKTLQKSARIKKIEDIFPDFLQLMSSNLRAGMTIDRAILVSSRPEFSPLDEEILRTGKDIATSKNLEKALIDMGGRIGSEKIEKTINLIISGIRAGGDLSVLLEQTSVNVREKEIVEKKAASNVLMYVIFIFLVVAVFAPALFSLSNVLIEVLTDILSGLPSTETSVNVPFSLSKINISINFIQYFSVFFIIMIDIMASLILGLVNKGEEKQGLKYLPAILIISLSVFFLARIIISNFMKGIL